MMRYIISIVVMLLWIMGLAHAQETPIEWACVIEMQWLSAEDEYEFPFILVTTEGDFVVENNTEVCTEAEEKEDEKEDERIDWSSQVAAVYTTDTGVEIYCMDEDGDGTLGLIINADTPDGAASTCATFYILEDGVYQINTNDGQVYISNNIYFIGAENDD